MVKAEIPYKSFIELTDDPQGLPRLNFQGNKAFVDLVLDLKKRFGHDPKKWPLLDEKKSECFILNEFILKLKGEYRPAYNHEEICHCRTITTEKVLNVIKDGCQSVGDVSRTTMAGTGCGSCHKDIEKLIQQICNQKSES
ncbi:MAG: (2Fe-2S)-binding protein [Pseudobdellovibrio sp.]